MVEGQEVSHLINNAYNAVKDNAGDVIQAGQEKGAEMVEKGKGIKYNYNVH